MPLDVTQYNPVAPDDGSAKPPEPAEPLATDVVSKPSKYYGLPNDIAKILEMSSPSRTLAQRMLNADIPKYAFQLGAGGVEAATLGLVDPGQNPETTGEALIRGAGNLLGSMYNPVGPTVALAGKLKKSTTVAGALAGVAAAEIQTKGEASAERLMLEGAFGALFGRFYGNRQLAKAAARKPTGEIDLTLPEESPLMRIPVPGQLALPAPPSRTIRPDFYGSAAEAESQAGKTLRAAQQTITRGGPFDELDPYTPPNRPNIDVLTPEGQYSPNAIVGQGLFSELGIKRKAGTTRKLAGDDAQQMLKRMRFDPDPDVRETAKAVDTFIKNSDDIDEVGLVAKANKIRNGEELDESNALHINPWEDLYTTEKIPRAQLRTGITELSKFRLPEYVFADVEKATGGRIPAYGMFWNAAEGRDAARKLIGAEGVKLKGIVRGVDRKANNEGLLEFLQTDDFNTKAILATTHGLSPSDIKRAEAAYEQVETLWNRNFTTPWKKYMTEIIPALKRNTPGEVELLKAYNADVDEVTRWAANHEISFKGESLTQFMAAHIRALALKEHFDPHYKTLSKIAGDNSYPKPFRDYVGDWANRARGTASLFAHKWNPTYRKMWARLGVQASEHDVRDIMDNYIGLTHAGLVGFRPAPLMHNMFGLVQTGNRIGPKWVYHGLKKSGTAEGKQLARDMGLVSEAAHEVEALRELTAPGRFTRFARGAARIGLYPYGKVDDVNRAAIGIGMHDRFLEAARRAGTNREKLLSESGLYRFHEAIRDHTLEPWAKGDVEGAARLAGIHAAQATQWVYRTEYKPTVMNGGLSRAFLQFGIWPMNYMEYMRQMLHGIDMPRRERVKWFIDFGLSNASIVGAMGAVGATVGLGAEAMRNTASWTFAGPLSYAGGPALDLFLSLPKLARDFQDRAWGATVNDATLNRVKSNLVNTIPMVGLQRDIARAKGPLEQDLREIVPTMRLSESERVLPSKTPEEELFRLITGIGVKE